MLQKPKKKMDKRCLEKLCLDFYYKNLVFMPPLTQLFTTFLHSNSDRFDKVKLVTALENGLQSVVNWVKKWLINSNAFKTKLLNFSYQRLLFLSTITMADTNL